MTIVPATKADGESPAPACAGRSLELFYEAKNQTEALEVCGGCPRQALCLEEDLQRPITHQYGVRGGMTATARKKLIRARRAEMPETVPASLAPVIELVAPSSVRTASRTAVAA